MRVGRVRHAAQRGGQSLDSAVYPTTMPHAPAWADTAQAPLENESSGPRRVCFDMDRFSVAVRRERALANQRRADLLDAQRQAWQQAGYAQGSAHAQHQWLWLGVLIGGSVASGICYGLFMLKAAA